MADSLNWGADAAAGAATKKDVLLEGECWKKWEGRTGRFVGELDFIWLEAFTEILVEVEDISGGQNEWDIYKGQTNASSA